MDTCLRVQKNKYFFGRGVIAQYNVIRAQIKMIKKNYKTKIS
jgi:hypothetical protein